MSEEKVGRRKYLKYAGAGIVAVAVVGAGYYFTQKPKEMPEVVFFCMDPVGEIALANQADLEERYGIKLTAKKAGINLGEEIMLHLTAHTGDVDVILQYIEHVGQFHQYYIPFTDENLRKYDIDLSDFLESAVTAIGMYDDAHKFDPRGGGEVLYNLPTGAMSEFFCYRKDWFEDPAEQASFKDKYGYDMMPPEDGWAFAEFCDVLEFWTRPEKGIRGMFCSLHPMEILQNYWGLGGVYSAGVYYADRNGVPTWNIPQNLQGLYLLQHMFKQGWIVPEAIGLAIMEGHTLLKEGKVAITASWDMLMGDLEKEGSPIKGKVGYTVTPSWKEPRGKPRSVPGVESWVIPGSKTRMNTGGWNMGVNKDSKNVDAAFTFVKWLLSEEVMRKAVKQQGWTAARKSILGDPETLKICPYATTNMKAWTEDRGWICIIRCPEMGLLQQATGNRLQETFSKLRDPKEVLDECQQEAIKIWEKAGYPTKGEFLPW